MKTTSSFIFIFLIIIVNAAAQGLEGLQEKIESQLALYKTKENIPVYYSEDQSVSAEFSGELCAGANA